MTTAQIVVLVILVLVLIAAAPAYLMLRRRRLQSRFGPEYDRMAARADRSGTVDRELLDRERRHAGLTLRTIDGPAAERYGEQWRVVQAQFVTDPAAAVVAGDDLVTRLVADRGYPTSGYDEQLALLSVEHARPLEHYRDAHEIYLRANSGGATTEELRQALVHYREIFADLLGEEPESLVDTHRAAPSPTDLRS